MVATDDVTEGILRVTLEIIYLLTGEDYGPRKKSAEGAILYTDSCMSGGQGNRVRPPPLIHERTHEQKILELTSKIIELLTGEVPVRSQDVTVHLSMEEWEYLEGHKDQYKDVMMEDHQPLTSPVEFVSSGCSPIHIKGEDVTKEEDVTKDGGHLSDDYIFTTTNHSQQDPSPHVKQEILCGGENLQDTDTPTEHTDYVSFLIKEEGPLGFKENPSDTSKPSSEPGPAPHFRGEPISCPGGDLAEADRTQQYPSTPLKEGLVSYEGENLTNVYTPADHPQQYPTSKEEPLSRQPEKLTSVYTPRSPSQYGSTCMKKEPISRDEEEMTEADIYTSSGHTRRQDGENHINTNVYTPTDLPQHPSGPTKDRAKDGLELWSKPDVFSCSECDKMFHCKSELLMHLPVHSGDKPYNCSICGKCFTNLSYLITHGKIHAGEKRYSCPDCGVSFTRSSNLKAHKRKHTGEKPYLCSDCGKSFSSNSNLNAHRKRHTGDKPYSCPDCGKSFISRSHLVVHQRTHTGEKPYTCPLCIKCFSNTSDLAKHRKIHNKKPYYCSKCGKCYKSNPDFDNQKLHICNS